MIELSLDIDTVDVTKVNVRTVSNGAEKAAEADVVVTFTTGIDILNSLVLDPYAGKAWRELFNLEHTGVTHVEFKRTFTNHRATFRYATLTKEATKQFEVKLHKFRVSPSGTPGEVDVAMMVTCRPGKGDADFLVRQLTVAKGVGPALQVQPPLQMDIESKDVDAGKRRDYPRLVESHSTDSTPH